jgi:hypothetical protein
MDHDELALQIWENEGGALAEITLDRGFGRVDRETRDLTPSLKSEREKGQADSCSETQIDEAQEKESPTAR